MERHHLKTRDYTTSQWSGGTTTQIYIYPPEAEYKKGDYLARISSATVELDESDFTPLAGVTRYITPIKGQFTLTHPGKAPIVMASYDSPYRFSGDEATHCVGRASDFNLMLKGISGEMSIETGEIHLKKGLNCLYSAVGQAIKVNGEKLYLDKGDSLVAIVAEGEECRVVCERLIYCFAEI